jgi:hypothetical protein
MSGRLPNEVRAMHRQQGTNRLTQQDVVHGIADKMSTKIGRPLGQLELRSLINHLRKLDGNKFRTMPIDNAMEQIASSYLALMSGSDNVIYDTHEIMKQYIGGGVRVTPDRFTIKKQCGFQTDTPSDPASVIKAGGHRSAYGMFPRTEEFKNKEKTENMTGSDGAEIRTADVDSALVRTLKSKYNEDEDVPVYGEWLRKNNMIVPRQRNIYMLLDSRYKNRSTGPNVFSWTVSSVPSDSQGVVSTMKSMQNIIFMQFSKFLIPYSVAADNVYNKVSLLINELQFAAVMGHENRHYHALFDTEVQGNRILCTPDPQDEGKFRFNEPINYLKTISITFGGPLNKLSFLPEYYSTTITSNAVNSTYINFLQDHGVTAGEQVYIVGFTTASKAIDFAAIGEINNEIGHIVAVVDNVTLEITTDLSTSTLISPNPAVECYITTRRILIPVRFTYLT